MPPNPQPLNPSTPQPSTPQPLNTPTLNPSTSQHPNPQPLNPSTSQHPNPQPLHSPTHLRTRTPEHLNPQPSTLNPQPSTPAFTYAPTHPNTRTPIPTNIFTPLQFGKETFHPISADEKQFVMDWHLEKGGSVPAHIHKYMDEHFAVTEGEVTFMVSGKPVVKRPGEELLVPMNTVHGIHNKSGARIGVRVTYSPASDTRRMFEIIAELNAENPGSMMNMVKYFYIAPRIGLKDFSNPQPAWVDSLLKGIAGMMGFFGGWKKYVKRFS